MYNCRSTLQGDLVKTYEYNIYWEPSYKKTIKCTMSV
jgi:hypothetical protein